MKTGLLRLPAKLNSNNGFTILEALIALFLLVGAVTIAIGMQTTAITGSGNARETSEAASYATDKIEQLASLDYSTDPALGNGDHTLPDEGPYSFSYNIQRDVLLQHTMTISMTVSWVDQGKNKSMLLEYLKYDQI